MNPYGVSSNIFQSTSDQSANSFRDPMNISHLYPGWGTNPNYQTPAHDAPYRPAYQGPNPYAAYQKPSFAGGIGQLFNPFHSDPYWGNPVSNNAQAASSVGGKPWDAAATIGQNFIAPAVTFGVTQAVFRGMGSAIGRGFGTGLATGLGASAGVAGGVGAAAGLFGSFAVPFAIGTGVMAAVEKGIFQPYIRSRQMSEMVNDNFSGVTFGGGGNVISGRGLSNSQSASLGSGIDRMGMMDMTFSGNQFGGIASMGMRAGLFSDTNSSGDILKRVGSIASQIKMIVAISKDPNIQNAIEELAKLRTGGASISGGYGSVAAGAYSSIGMQASAAGASVQRLMNTVGSQGQYMYQMNGITPYLGQLSAATAFSGFESASRNGLLSRAQMARMGGSEGATQSALGAQISASSTMFNRMGLANKFIGGVNTSGVVGTISAFGSMASRDPLSTAGNMGLYGNHMVSQQMAGPEGIKSLENQAVQILEGMGKRAGPGGHDAGAVYQTMLSMGVPPEQLQAYFSMRASQTNPDIVAQNVKAFRAQGKEQMRQAMSTNSLGGGEIESAFANIRKFGKRTLLGAANKFAYSTSQLAGEFADAFGLTSDKIMFDSSLGDYLRDGDGYQQITPDGIKGQSADVAEVIRAINKSAKGGGEGGDIARKLLSRGFDGDEGKELFGQFLGAQTDPRLREHFDGLKTSIGLYDKTARAVRGNIKNVDGQRGKMSEDSLRVMDQAAEVHMSGGLLTTTLQKTLNDPRYADLKKTLSGLGVDAQSSAISALARGRLRAAGVNFNGNATEEEVNALLSPMMSTNTAIRDAQGNSSSRVDYRQYVEASNSIDRGAKMFMEAVDKFASTQGISNSGPNAWQRFAWGDGQKSVGK